MSDIKYCPSCGTSLSASAVFCHKCGQKQIVTPNPKPVETNVAPTPDAFSLAAEQPQEQPSKQPKETEPVFEAEAPKKVEKTEATEAVNESPKETEQAPVPSVIQPENKQQDFASPTPASKPGTAAEQPIQPVPQLVNSRPSMQPAQPVQQVLQQTNAKPAVQQANPAYQPVQPPTYQQTQPPYQQGYYQQNSITQQSTASTPKKKFPWFFSIVWFILLVAIGIWSFFLFFSEAYQKPVFTEDAQRIVIFVIAIGILIYTLSLKLTMKKLKVLPTVILVIAAIIGLYLFCMVELMDGDWLHDTVSEITNSILPTFGE